MTDFIPFYKPDMGPLEHEKIGESLDSGWITTGPKVQEFEKSLQEHLAVEDILTLNSCTAGLHLGLIALDLQPGEEVVTTPLTFCATANVVEHCGGRVVLADINPETFLIDPAAVAEKVTNKTKILLPVHFAGQVVDRKAIDSIGNRNGIAVLEDAAHLFPTREYTGESKNLMAFSFYANKNIATGEGGALAGPKNLIEKVRTLALHGLSKNAWKRFDKKGAWEYDVASPGYKYNMTDVQAAMGLSQLHRMEGFAQKRKELFSLYQELFAEVPEIRMMKLENHFSYHILPVVVDFSGMKLDRNQLIEEMKNRGIGTSMHYIPLYKFSYYQEKYNWNPEHFPNCHAVTENSLTLPLFTKMTDDQVRRVVTTLKEIFVEFKK